MARDNEAAVASLPSPSPLRLSMSPILIYPDRRPRPRSLVPSFVRSPNGAAATASVD